MKRTYIDYVTDILTCFQETQDEKRWVDGVLAREKGLGF